MEIKGLRSRVTIGFVSIATLLFLSGMLSFFELNTLSDDTNIILRTNKRNMELSRSLINALQSQNNTFVQIVAFGDRSLDSLCMASVNNLEHTIKMARTISVHGELIDSMTLTAMRLRSVTERLIAARAVVQPLIEVSSLDSLSRYNNRDIYMDYQPIYNSMLNFIDQYINLTQESLAPRAESLHHNAYRAVTPVFISLVVMIIIVLMLYYFMLLYCVNPVVAMNKSLADWLSYKIPFSPKGECRDEMLELKEHIEYMVNQQKKQKF